MKQYMPNKYKTIEDIQDSFDIRAVYNVLEYSAGINISKDEKEVVESAKEEKESVSWDSLDLAKLETEVFLLGIWKNFDELEKSICIEELMQILSITRELDYEEKRFMAALQGIDLDEKQGEERGQKEWENLKARVASGGQATDSRDILALQGTAARQAGFGIGIGLGYEDLRDPKVLKKQ
jgi:translation initiation factor 1 (eIF-1/SUI1)